jgi:hypothetical protein
MPKALSSLFNALYRLRQQNLNGGVLVSKTIIIIVYWMASAESVFLICDLAMTLLQPPSSASNDEPQTSVPIAIGIKPQTIGLPLRPMTIEKLNDMRSRIAGIRRFL